MATSEKVMAGTYDLQKVVFSSMYGFTFYGNWLQQVKKRVTTMSVSTLTSGGQPGGWDGMLRC